MALDYRQAAQEILDAIGGPGNVVSAAHCATRLRLVLADDAKVDQAAVDNAAGAKGNFKASGQLQVIYGTGTVNKVYDEVIALGHITAATKAEVKEAAAQQQTNPFMRAIKLLGDVFVPIIPAIVASGLLLGIMSALSFMDANGFIALDTNNAWYQILNLVSNTAFTFLQILIGFSAAKAFGANSYLGAVVGMLLINPGLQNANTVATEGVLQTYPVIPGLYSIEWTGYQGHVIPIVIACGILAFVEKRLHKVVPEAFDLFVTPLVSVAATAYVTMLAVGPIFVWAENAILGGIQFLLTLPLGLGSLIMGALYAPTVVTGIHQMYTTIDLGQIATYGITYWLPARPPPPSPWPSRPRTSRSARSPSPPRSPPSWASPSPPSSASTCASSSPSWPAASEVAWAPCSPPSWGSPRRAPASPASLASCSASASPCST